MRYWCKRTVGVAYPATLSVTGGTPPYTFSVQSGSLPPGLTLSGGRIAGTPTTVASYTFTILVRDSRGNTDTATCTIVVVGAPLDLQCGSCGSGNATVGAAYPANLSVTGGLGPFPYSISSGQLPPGLTLNAATGAISGTPTTAGT